MNVSDPVLARGLLELIAIDQVPYKTSRLSKVKCHTVVMVNVHVYADTRSLASACTCSQTAIRSCKHRTLPFPTASSAVLSLWLVAPFQHCHRFHHFRCLVRHCRGRACRPGSYLALVVCLLGDRTSCCPVHGMESYERQPMCRERRE